MKPEYLQNIPKEKEHNIKFAVSCLFFATFVAKEKFIS